MVTAVCKQEGVNEQFTDISTIVRSFMGLREAVLSVKTDGRPLCKPQTRWLHASVLSCKDNQVQIQMGHVWFFFLSGLFGRQRFTVHCDKSWIRVFLLAFAV